MNNEFDIVSKIQNNVMLLITDGYINNKAGEKILEVFSNSFTEGINKVVMDLGKSKVVNSIGISYLIDIIERLSESNSELIFTNLDPTIEKTFKIMGIFQFAQQADSVESALK